MKLLLDENLPTKLKSSFSTQHQVLTVKDQNWSGAKNGELLRLMKKSGFDALITVDKNLGYQQNTELLGLKVFVLNAVNNKLTTLEPYVEILEELLNHPNHKNITVVDMID